MQYSSLISAYYFIFFLFFLLLFPFYGPFIPYLTTCGHLADLSLEIIAISRDIYCTTLLVHTRKLHDRNIALRRSSVSATCVTHKPTNFDDLWVTVVENTIPWDPGIARPIFGSEIHGPINKTNHRYTYICLWNKSIARVNDSFRVNLFYFIQIDRHISFLIFPNKITGPSRWDSRLNTYRLFQHRKRASGNVISGHDLVFWFRIAGGFQQVHYRHILRSTHLRITRRTYGRFLMGTV